MNDGLAPFESPKELINGAKEQLAQLERECRFFEDHCPYSIVTHIDHKTRENVVALRLQNRLPAKIRRLASSILKETRLALDQAMCDGALELGRKNARGVYFPFGKTAKDLRNSRIKNCKDVDRRLIAFALKFKPYYGGNPVLWTLSKLASVSHQRIVNAQPQDQAAFAKAILQTIGPLKIIINSWDASKQEFEVARLSPNAHLTFQKDFVLTQKIIFSGTTYAATGRPLTTTLHEMIGVAESVVLGIEAETNRIKGVTTHGTTRESSPN